MANVGSAGTIGAQVLVIYGVIQNKMPTIDKTLKAINSMKFLYICRQIQVKIG